MSYVEKVLQPGEKLRYQAAIHWITYAHGVAWLIAAGFVWMITPTAWRGGYVAATGGYFFSFALFCLEFVLVAAPSSLRRRLREWALKRLGAKLDAEASGVG